MKKLAVLSICIALVFCVSFITSAVASDEEDVLEVSKAFVKGLDTDDSKLINSLYWQSPDKSVWGPEGDGALLSQGWLEDESDTDTNEESETTSVVTLHHPKVTMLGKDSAVTTVYHQWVTTNKTTNETIYQYVRQTEVVKKINGKWLLVHVHASMLPTE